MPLGTAKNLSQHAKSLNVMYRNQLINSVTTYKYLGVDLDQALNMNSNFDSIYKKASGRLRLLRKIRPYLNTISSKGNISRHGFTDTYVLWFIAIEIKQDTRG